MTPREIILAVLNFSNPPRVGYQLPDPYPCDVVFGWPKYSTAHERLAPRGNEVRRWKDAWGATWASLTEYDKGEVVAAAIEDWGQLDTYCPPDLGRAEDYAEVASLFEKERDRFRIGGLEGFPFSVAQDIRRLDNYLCDLALEAENVRRLHALIREPLLRSIDRYAEIGADAVMFWEDWGTQDRLLVSPQMWREIFRPDFETLVGRAHRRGLKVIMHSCGAIGSILDDLVEVGIDCLQLDQPSLHGIDTLAERYGGRVAFWCPVDIQRTLQTRDEGKIRREARALVEKLGGFGGGFIAGCYTNNRALGLDPKFQNMASDEFVRWGGQG